jgi:hypothetical protein
LVCAFKNTVCDRKKTIEKGLVGSRGSQKWAEETLQTEDFKDLEASIGSRNGRKVFKVIKIFREFKEFSLKTIKGFEKPATGRALSQSCIKEYFAAKQGSQAESTAIGLHPLIQQPQL